MSEAVFVVDLQNAPKSLLEHGYPLLLTGIASNVLTTFIKGSVDGIKAQDFSQEANVAQLMALSTAVQVCGTETAMNLLNVVDSDTEESLRLVHKYFEDYFLDKLCCCESLEDAQELWDEMQESFKLALSYWNDCTVNSRPDWMPDIRRPTTVLVSKGSEEIH